MNTSLKTSRYPSEGQVPEDGNLLVVNLCWQARFPVFRDIVASWDESVVDTGAGINCG